MRADLSAVCLLLLAVPPAAAYEIQALNTDLSGYAKTLNIFTRTGGLAPEQITRPADPLAATEAKEDLFSTLERVRLKTRTHADLPMNQRLVAKIDYDHQAQFGSLTATGDFRYARKMVEDRQFWDSSQTLVEKEDGVYEHRFYRASVLYEHPWGSAEAGRQQIPWGLGHFFTPTDVFNSFNPVQVELDEREGVDAVNLKTRPVAGVKTQWVFTPRGRRMHPARSFARFSKDVREFEAGVLGGFINRDIALGADLAGNIRDSVVRGEILYRDPEGKEKEFFKFTVNTDYNFPKNIHALLEYHFNGQGRRHFRDYQRDRATRADITQMARNYLALLLGRDLTPLLRFEHRTIFNLDDVSFYLRPELRYEVRTNLVLTLAAQLFLGANSDEFGSPRNLFLGELKYSF